MIYIFFLNFCHGNLTLNFNKIKIFCSQGRQLSHPTSSNLVSQTNREIFSTPTTALTNSVAAEKGLIYFFFKCVYLNNSLVVCYNHLYLSKSFDFSMLIKCYVISILIISNLQHDLIIL